jgi:hypothetical protein
VSRIVRYEFMGSWLFLWVCCVTIVGIPIAVLYLLNGTIRIEEDVNDPERLAAYLRSCRSGKP